MHPINAVMMIVRMAICLYCLSSTIDARSITVPSPGIGTIAQAMIQAKESDTIWVQEGVYREHVVFRPGVAMKAQVRFKAVIDGGGRGIAVTMSKGNALEGFVVRNGTIGVFSDGSDAVIRECKIHGNWQTGLMSVRHLPLIEDNIIAFNRASGIQVWDVRASSGMVNHNTIAYNGNHGIAIGGNSMMTIQNNVIAYNERFGIKHPEKEKRRDIIITSNNVYHNLPSRVTLPKGNFSFDPAFIAPRAKLNFMPDPKLCCQAKGNDNKNMGARITDY